MYLLILRVVDNVVLRLFARAHALAGLALRHDLVPDPGEADQTAIVASSKVILTRSGHKVAGAVAIF